MNNIKKFNDFISEKYILPNSGNWIVYSNDRKVVGCNLTYSDAQKLSTMNGTHNISGQNGNNFQSIEDAQVWLANKFDTTQEDEEKLKTYTSNPIKKSLFGLANLVKKRFENIDPFVLAYWIGKIFGINTFLFISKIERSQHPKDIKNVYVVVDELYFNIDGFHTKEELMDVEKISKWSINDFTFISNLDTVKEKIKDIENKLSTKEKQEFISTLYNFKRHLQKRQ